VTVPICKIREYPPIAIITLPITKPMIVLLDSMFELFRILLKKLAKKDRLRLIPVKTRIFVLGFMGNT
jgi:hypothetical protein